MWYLNCVVYCCNYVIINCCDFNVGSFGVGIYVLMRKGKVVEWFVFGVFIGLGSCVWFCGKMCFMNIGMKIIFLKLV